MTLSHSAIQALKALIAEHPEDPFVRVSLQDLDDQRLLFSITLEAELKPDDQRFDCEGLTIGIEGRNAPRMEGVTLDYQEGKGFTFLHPARGDHGWEGPDPISLN